MCAVVDDDDAPKMEFIKFDFFMLYYILFWWSFCCFYGARPSILWAAAGKMREVNSFERTKLWGEFGFFFCLLFVNLAETRSEGEIASAKNKNNSKFFSSFFLERWNVCAWEVSGGKTLMEKWEFFCWVVVMSVERRGWKDCNECSVCWMEKKSWLRSNQWRRLMCRDFSRGGEFTA